VLADPVALLSDHAHLEKKAAANALTLLGRRPDLPGWTATLAQIAREEAEHLALVLKHLAARGGRLSAEHRNPYAAALHAHVALADRLFVSALIEARSCERFGLLAAAARDAGLARLYRSLATAERRHGAEFLDLARSLPLRGAAETRWSQWLQREAVIAREQPPGPRLHSGPPREGAVSGAG
jgi:tRNA 2-(methylsulfanyl)-N6-isopentenyladenosine37 hydroxylase